jgi:hypothetical protein
VIPGKYSGTIEENDIRTAGSGTEFVFLRVNIDGTAFPVQIWLTEKASGMARAQLRQCGFDVDRDDLSLLSENTSYLVGRQVPIEIFEEEYKGRLQTKAKISTGTVSRKRIGSLSQMLRAAGREEPVSVASEAKSGDPDDDIPF